MNWLFTQENITFAIAVAGFLLSLGQIIVSLIKSRENYRLAVVDYAQRDPNCIQFLMCVENRANLPLCITSIGFQGVTCELVRKAIRETPDAWNFQHTADFPLCLAPHSSLYAYVEFLDVSSGSFSHTALCHGTTVSFEIHSTRKLAQKKLVLGDISHYLHTTAQHRDYLLSHNQR